MFIKASQKHAQLVSQTSIATNLGLFYQSNIGYSKISAFICTLYLPTDPTPVLVEYITTAEYSLHLKESNYEETLHNKVHILAYPAWYN